MKTGKHILSGVIIGATFSILPDVILATYRWKANLKPDHYLARLHRFFHSPQSLYLLAMICWAFHLLSDWFTHPPHLYEKNINLEFWEEEERKFGNDV